MRVTANFQVSSQLSVGSFLKEVKLITSPCHWTVCLALIHRRRESRRHGDLVGDFSDEFRRWLVSIDKLLFDPEFKISSYWTSVGIHYSTSKKVIKDIIVPFNKKFGDMWKRLQLRRGTWTIHPSHNWIALKLNSMLPQTAMELFLCVHQISDEREVRFEETSSTAIFPLK
jgi:hypothetical protein